MTEFDIRLEGPRLAEAAQAADVPLRLVGGIAIHYRVPAFPASLERTYGDVDFVARSKSTSAVKAFFEASGYQGEAQFNSINGRRRLLFHHPDTGAKVDVFIGDFEMCHTIPVDPRIDMDPVTMPLADLLLMKLQIVEFTEKDRGDAMALLVGGEVSTADGLTSINGQYIAELTAGDWGLWRTATMNLGRIIEAVPSVSLSDPDAAAVVEKAEQLLAMIEDQPKSSAWRFRSRIGDRKRWYEEPEEVD